MNSWIRYCLAIVVFFPGVLRAQSDSGQIFRATYASIETHIKDLPLGKYGVITDDPNHRVVTGEALPENTSILNTSFAESLSLPFGSMDEIFLCPDYPTMRGCALKGDITHAVSFLLESEKGGRASVLVVLHWEQNIARIPIASRGYRATLEEVEGTWVVSAFEGLWVS